MSTLIIIKRKKLENIHELWFNYSWSFFITSFSEFNDFFSMWKNFYSIFRCYLNPPPPPTTTHMALVFHAFKTSKCYFLLDEKKGWAECCPLKYLLALWKSYWVQRLTYIWFIQKYIRSKLHTQKSTFFLFAISKLFWFITNK